MHRLELYFLYINEKVKLAVLLPWKMFFKKGLTKSLLGISYMEVVRCLYSTPLVKVVNAFTLDSSIGDFCLSHPNIKIPSQGSIYSVNEGNYDQFGQNIKDYIDYCRNSIDKKAYSARYIGSMVADFHRNLLKGGIFMYPSTTDSPNGKLRLMFESNPMAFITEQAGGIATTGEDRILELQPTEIHQRNPVIMGSADMVKKALSY